MFWAGLGWVVPLNLGFLGSGSHEQTRLLWLDGSGLLIAGLAGWGTWALAGAASLSNWFFQWPRQTAYKAGQGSLEWKLLGVGGLSSGIYTSLWYNLLVGGS